MAARITDSFAVREVAGLARGGRSCVQLLEPVVYHVGSADSPETITVPPGFITDFASIPLGLWNLFPPLGPWARPAIVHDFLCDTLGTGQWRVDDQVTFLGCTRVKPYSSKEAAEIFREALEIPELKIPAWRRAVMYRAVRHFGPRWP